MAREVRDREDLLRDATAFAERLQLRVVLDGRSVEVFAGFRADGGVSLYFGAEPVYQFNSAGELRRAFDGHVIKAERGSLVALDPKRSDSAVEMVRTEFQGEQLRDFGESMLARISGLRRGIDGGEYEIEGAEPPEQTDAMVARLRAWLGERRALLVAESPRVG